MKYDSEEGRSRGVVVYMRQRGTQYRVRSDKNQTCIPSNTHSIRRRTRRGQTEISRDAKVAVGTKGLRGGGGNNFYEHPVVGLVASQVLVLLSRQWNKLTHSHFFLAATHDYFSTERPLAYVTGGAA